MNIQWLKDVVAKGLACNVKNQRCMLNTLFCDPVCQVSGLDLQEIMTLPPIDLSSLLFCSDVFCPSCLSLSL